MKEFNPNDALVANFETMMQQFAEVRTLIKSRSDDPLVGIDEIAEILQMLDSLEHKCRQQAMIFADSFKGFSALLAEFAAAEQMSMIAKGGKP